MHRELLAAGHVCNRKTVEKLMCQAGLRAKACRRFRVTTTDSRHNQPIAANLLARNFQPSAKHQAWTMDITYIPTGEGWLYLALVEDLYSRKIVGWSMSERIDSQLVADALDMAIQREQPRPGLLAHFEVARFRWQGWVRLRFSARRVACFEGVCEAAEFLLSWQFVVAE